MDNYIRNMANIYDVPPEVFEQYDKEFGYIDIHILMNDMKKREEFKDRLKTISQYRYFKLKRLKEKCSEKEIK